MRNMRKPCWKASWKRQIIARRISMGIDDQNKLVNAGFQIIRKDDYPSPRIKFVQAGMEVGRRIRSLRQRLKRDRAFALLLKDEKIISD